MLCGNNRDAASRGYDRMMFRLPWGDPRAEKLMVVLKNSPDASLVPANKLPGRGHVTDVVFMVPRDRVKRFPGLMAYRISQKWEGFGPGSLEGIEYMIVSKGRSRAKQVKLRGTYIVYGPYGETTVEIPETTIEVDDLDSESLREAIEDEIQWFLDENPELYAQDEEEEGYEASRRASRQRSRRSFSARPGDDERSLRRSLIRLARAEPSLRGDLLALLRGKSRRAGKDLSTVPKKPAPHMWFISKDPSGGFLVTIGDPRRPTSKIKERFSDVGELKYWVRHEIGRKVSPDHVYDVSGLNLVPNVYSQWYVDNMMRAGAGPVRDTRRGHKPVDEVLRWIDNFATWGLLKSVQRNSRIWTMFETASQLRDPDLLRKAILKADFYGLLTDVWESEYSDRFEAALSKMVGKSPWYD